MLLHRRVRVVAAATVLAGVSMLTPAAVDARAQPTCGDGPDLRYLVLFDPSVTESAAGQEVEALCGSLTQYYSAIGVGVVESAEPAFDERIGADRAYSAQLAARGRAAADDQSATASPDGAGEWNMAAIQAGHARAITPGNRDVVVGVLDSGIDAEHPELAAAVDPDRSADCLTGAPRSPAHSWKRGDSTHGTHVAGIVAAADDGRGVTGVAPGVRVASIRVVDKAGYAHPEYAVCGFVWAAEHGVRVANTSFLVEAAQEGCGTGAGSPVPREAVRRAVEYATARGVLTVAAVGNKRVDIASRNAQRQPNCDAVPVDLDDVVAVSSVGKTPVKASYSSYGLGAVDLTAPGGESQPEGEECVRSTVPGGYGTACGTSMAAPHVSGVAALAATQHPTAGPRALAKLLTQRSKPMSCPSDYDLNGDGVQDALCRGYDSYNGFYGHGMVDALRAVLPDNDDERGAKPRTERLDRSPGINLR